MAINNNFKLTVSGEEFIRQVCRGNGNSLLRGTNGILPYSNNINKTWVSSLKDDQNNLITQNNELGELLIQWFNEYGQEFNLDPNILAAQAYIESNYRIWIYSNSSTASGINQFIMNTVYSVIVDNFSDISPKMSENEIGAITKGLTDPELRSSYNVTEGTPQTKIIARTNRGILHQNIIDNPKIMIKAQARYMKYFSNSCEKLASSSLFCYSRGSRFISNTYSNTINKSNKDKGENYTQTGIDYVLKIFGILGDKENKYLPFKNYKPKGYSFGYDKDLNLGGVFDAFNANVIESEQYNIRTLDNLPPISNDSRYSFIYFPEDQYDREKTYKEQIVLHHTVSGDEGEGEGVGNDIRWWRNKGEKVATSFIISRGGSIFQLFSTDFWAFHLGLNTSNNIQLNKNSIGIEIDSWGGLIYVNGNWYPAAMDSDGDLQKRVANQSVEPVTNIQQYNSSNGYPNGFRGFFAFEKYTQKQIDSVRDLILSIHNKFTNISLLYNGDMWDVSQNALLGNSGIWTHVSYRMDKSDCHPQPELIDMLKGLESIVSYNNMFSSNSTSGNVNKKTLFGNVFK